MADAYLKKQISSSKLKKDLCEQIGSILKSSNTKALEKIRIKPLDRNKKGSLQNLIEKHLEKLNAADVELNLRRAKLREAKRLKKELEGKLSHITESIETLNSIEDYSKVKTSLQGSQVRQEYLKEEKLKATQIKQKSIEYYHEQKKRQDKIQNHIQEIEKEIQNEKALKQQQIQEQQKLREKQYQDKLKKMHQKKELREKELEELKQRDEILKKVQHEKPLFVKISENYWKTVEMKELENRKKELSKKRMLQSISSKQILDHAKWYETIKQDNEKKFKKELDNRLIDRKVQSSDSTFTVWKQRLIEEEKKAREEKKRMYEERLKMIDKKTTYANFVKQMYLPSIDTTKQKEIEQRKLKLSASSKIVKHLSQEEPSKSSQWKPHTFKPNPLIPKVETKPPPKVTDYLTDLRKLREENEKENNENKKEDDLVQFELDEKFQSLSEADKIKFIKKKSRLIEKALKKKELAMSSTIGTSQNLKYSDDINEMLISSIKAKLAVLEKTE
jgi:hypothetical protein